MGHMGNGHTPIRPPAGADPSAAVDDLRRWLFADRWRSPTGEPDPLADNGAFWAALALAAHAEGGPPPTLADLQPLARAFRDVFAAVAGDVPVRHAVDDLLVTLGFRPHGNEKTALRRIAEASRNGGRVDRMLAVMGNEGVSAAQAAARMASRPAG